MPEPAAARPVAIGRLLPALILGQIGLHATMAGVRMAAPLQALGDGRSAMSVGVLMSLYAAAPVIVSMHAGRLADRLGFHRPVHLAAALSIGGALVAAASTLAPAPARFALLCLSAALVGSGANVGLIVVQRTAGLAAHDGTERMRVFSWLGMAPALSNVVGPVAAGFAIDAAGFGAAYALMLALPLLTLVCAARVPRAATAAVATPGAVQQRAARLLDTPGLKRLLVVNMLLSACWDVHAFAVPVLGHERGYAASTIGLILGTFTLSVSGVRLVIPLWAHRLHPVATLRVAMVGTGVVFALYPFAGSPWLMGLCASLLGLTLGAVQPMIMSTLHDLTPKGRHGEAIALRSMWMNASSTLLPLAFGATGAALGAAALFWMVGSAVAVGSWVARGLRRAAAFDA